MHAFMPKATEKALIEHTIKLKHKAFFAKHHQNITTIKSFSCFKKKRTKKKSIFLTFDVQGGRFVDCERQLIRLGTRTKIVANRRKSITKPRKNLIVQVLFDFGRTRKLSLKPPLIFL